MGWRCRHQSGGTSEVLPPAQATSKAVKSRRPAGRIVLVERPAGWAPVSELDMPERAVVIEVVLQPVSDPFTYVRQYNAISMDEAGTTWAVFPACGLTV